MKIIVHVLLSITGLFGGIYHHEIVSTLESAIPSFTSLPEWAQLSGGVLSLLGGIAGAVALVKYKIHASLMEKTPSPIGEMILNLMNSERNWKDCTVRYEWVEGLSFSNLSNVNESERDGAVRISKLCPTKVEIYNNFTWSEAVLSRADNVQIAERMKTLSEKHQAMKEMDKKVAQREALNKAHFDN